MSITNINEDKFLLALYNKDVFINEIQLNDFIKCIDYPIENLDNVITSLINKRLIIVSDKSKIKITSYGIDHVEELLIKHPNYNNNKRINFLIHLAKKGVTIGEDMYEVGEEMGWKKKDIENIVQYYSNRKVIEFPILGPYIKLVDDWIKVLNERDRKLLMNNFLLTLYKESHQQNKQTFTAKEIFEKSGIGAITTRIIPMIVQELVNRGLVESSDNYLVKLTDKGKSVIASFQYNQ